MKPLISARAPKAIGPYSQGVQVGQFVFLSGQVPLDPETMNVSGTNIEEQTAQVLKNIKALLSDVGLTMQQVFKTTVFLKNMSDFTRFNEVYSKAFEQPFPARTTVEVSRLPKDVLVEIEVVAEI